MDIPTTVITESIREGYVKTLKREIERLTENLATVESACFNLADQLALSREKLENVDENLVNACHQLEDRDNTIANLQMVVANQDKAIVARDMKISEIGKERAKLVPFDDDPEEEEEWLPDSPFFASTHTEEKETLCIDGNCGMDQGIAK